MKFRIRHAEKVVGLFILAALISLAAVLIFMGINQRWFAKDYQFQSRFQSGEGLKRGMPVKLKGFRIGSVDHVRLLEDNTAAIDFHIFDTYYGKVRENSVLELATSPLGIGGGGLLFHPGRREERLLPEGAHIPSLDFEEGRRLVEQGEVATLSRDDAVSSAVRQLDPLLTSARETLRSLNELTRTLDATIRGEDTGPLAAVLVHTDELLRRAGEASTALEETLGYTSAVAANLEETTARLSNTRGLVKELLDPQGSLAKLLDDDEELYRQLSGTLAQLEQIASRLDEFAAYVNEQQPRITTLLEEGEETMNRGQDVLEGLSNNPLLRGGIREGYTLPSTFGGMREEEF
jgi:phospholipid/cholesterol/gamma-HCH transport system substrate-binding protein